MKGFVRNLLALTGAASIVAALYALEHLDRKLHEYANGLKYGPARHVEYLGDVLHYCNRAAEISAAGMYQRVCDDEARKYDESEDARMRDLEKSRSV